MSGSTKLLIKIFMLVLPLLLFSACQPAGKANITEIPPVTEQVVTQFTLGEPLNKPDAELSGLTWAGDWLILLPQYPSRFKNQIFRLDKQNILTRLDGNISEGLIPEPVQFISNGIEKQIQGFEGYEAIATVDHIAYLTIEAGISQTGGYLVRAEWNQRFDQLTIDTDSLVPIEPQAPLSNTSDESVMVFGQRIVTFYEANGATINPNPIANLFNFQMESVDSLAMPSIEFRITDTSQPDPNGLFWAINYFYPGDRMKLKPAKDQLAIQYGQGTTHAEYEPVERLVAFQFSEDGIVLAPIPPIQLQLLPDDEARNWEGIVRLDDRGFLLVTDKFPETILAFVANP